MFRVFGEGRLTRDPEVREVNGTKVAEFTLATNEYRKSKNQGEPSVKVAHFFDCVIWDSGAKIIEQYCQKGSRLVIEGRPRQEKWTDKDGNNRSRVVFRVEEFSIVDSRREGENTDNAEPAGATTGPDTEEPPF